VRDVIQREKANQRFQTLESDVQTIAQTIRDGFERMNRRFTAMLRFMTLGFTVVPLVTVLVG
jgi:hypothetical protein